MPRQVATTCPACGGEKRAYERGTGKPQYHCLSCERVRAQVKYRTVAAERKAKQEVCCSSCGENTPLLDWPRDRGGKRLKHCGCRSKRPAMPRAAKLERKLSYRVRKAVEAGRSYLTREAAASLKADRDVERQRLQSQRRLHDSHVRQWKANHTLYRRWRYQHDPAFALKERIRRQLRKKGVALPGLAECIGSALKRGGESSTVERVLGYSITQLRHHLERQFTDGMTWDGLGRRGWHVDHILPKKFFDLSSIEGVQAYWSLSNLRPLFAGENLKKGSKRLHLV